jgi:predicted phosphoribosyltransferase
MLAALHVIKNQNPHEVIVAVPVGAPDRLRQISRHCDRLICLLAQEEFWAISQFYRDFAQVEDDTVVELLRDHARAEPVANSKG